MNKKMPQDLKVYCYDINGNEITDFNKITLSEEQIKQFARFIYDNRADIHKYIEDHKEEYNRWLKEKEVRY